MKFSVCPCTTSLWILLLLLIRLSLMKVSLNVIILTHLLTFAFICFSISPESWRTVLSGVGGGRSWQYVQTFITTRCIEAYLRLNVARHNITIFAFINVRTLILARQSFISRFTVPTRTKGNIKGKYNFIFVGWLGGGDMDILLWSVCLDRWPYSVWLPNTSLSSVSVVDSMSSHVILSSNKIKPGSHLHT